MSVRITCINKEQGNHFDPHHAIERLGWINEETQQTGNSSRLQMYDFVHGGGSAYVRGANGALAFLTARISAAGTKFVQTYADKTFTDNLLYLPECIG